MSLVPIVLDPADRDALIHAAKHRAERETRAQISGDDGPATAGLLTVKIAHGVLRGLAAGAELSAVERGLRQAHGIVLDVIRRLSRPEPHEGHVPGSGFVFVRALAVLELEDCHFFEDVRAGVHALRDALPEPTRALATSLGQSPDEVIDRMRKGCGAIGIDPVTGAYVDLVAAGVTTSTSTVHVALDCAVNAVLWLLRQVGTPVATTQQLRLGAAVAVGSDLAD